MSTIMLFFGIESTNDHLLLWAPVPLLVRFCSSQSESAAAVMF